MLTYQRANSMKDYQHLINRNQPNIFGGVEFKTKPRLDEKPYYSWLEVRKHKPSKLSKKLSLAVAIAMTAAVILGVA